VLAKSTRDPPHRTAADALDPAEQLRLAGEPAAAIVAHTGEDVAQGPVIPSGVRLVDHLRLAAAVALDAQEPARERAERLVERLCARGQRLGAGAAPVPPGRGSARQSCKIPVRRRVSGLRILGLLSLGLVVTLHVGLRMLSLGLVVALRVGRGWRIPA
jgi:hypothetical protein